jgi:GNAT superfamily N-acetyltransferase
MKNSGGVENLELRLAECNSNNEWKIAKHFRQHYFFDKAGLKDPYHWTFRHKDHKHFVLYQNSEIIGYAHIQLWPNHRAALRIIVIDVPQRKQGQGSALLSMIECYLKKKGSKSMHAEAHPEAVAFYKKMDTWKCHLTIQIFIRVLQLIQP